jgi:hypothetical protein
MNWFLIDAAAEAAIRAAVANARKRMIPWERLREQAIDDQDKTVIGLERPQRRDRRAATPAIGARLVASAGDGRGNKSSRQRPGDKGEAMAPKPRSRDWRKQGRANITRLSLLKRDIRAAQTRSRKRGIKPTLAPVKGWDGMR